MVVKVTVILAILCIIGTILSLPSFVPVLIYQQPYRILSSVFSHSGYLHLFYNLFGLIMFGIILERILGWKWYSILIIISIGFSEVGYMILSNPFIGAVGISGVVYGLIGALTALKPKMIIYTPFGPLPMFIAAIGWALIEIVTLGSSDMIAHSAHLFGLIGGITFGIFYRFKKILSPLLLISFLLIFILYPSLPKMPIYHSNCNSVDIINEKTFSYSHYECKNKTLIGIYLPNYEHSIEDKINRAKFIMENYGNFTIKNAFNKNNEIDIDGKLNQTNTSIKIKVDKYYSLYLIEISH